MIHECERANEMATKLVGGQHWSEDEKAHFLECVLCQKAVYAALEHKSKTQGPHPDSDPSRPAVQRALERARRVFQREFGISLPIGARRTPKTKAS